MARNSTEDLQGQASRVRQVGEDLGRRLCAGRLDPAAGERFRITAQLIDADRQTCLVGTLGPSGRRLFAVQTEIAEQVTNRLGGGTGLIQKAGRAARRKRPENLSAYELYLLGVDDCINSPAKASMRRSGCWRGPPRKTPIWPVPGSISAGPIVGPDAMAGIAQRRCRRQRPPPSARCSWTPLMPERMWSSAKCSPMQATSSRAKRNSIRPSPQPRIGGYTGDLRGDGKRIRQGGARGRGGRQGDPAQPELQP